MKKYFDYLNNDYHFDRQITIGILGLIIVISGVFGWTYEVIFYYFNSGMKEVYYRGANFLPWINIYAIGAVLILFLTYKKRKNPILVFFLSIIVTGILEYIGGAFMEHIMHIKCWDYNSEILSFGSINGYVCLRSVLVFGISALLLIYVIVPLCFFLAKKMSRRSFIILSYSLFTIFIFDELYNLIFSKILHLPHASQIYKKLGFKYLYF